MVEPPAKAQPVTVGGPAGSIEALASEPAGFDGTRAAVVCHPHPLHGGTMHNKVVHTVARTLEELGLATVRFNFRGVGKSEGVFDEGAGETDDARAVCDWARARWGTRKLWLAGFSFGALVAARLAAQENETGWIERLITIAPPVARFAIAGWINPACPWLIVHGDRDELVDVNEVRRYVAGMQPPPRLEVLEGVDHFFHGRLQELKDRLKHELGGEHR